MPKTLLTLIEQTPIPNLTLLEKFLHLIPGGYYPTLSEFKDLHDIQFLILVRRIHAKKRTNSEDAYLARKQVLFMDEVHVMW